jgi:ribosomal protein S10
MPSEAGVPHSSGVIALAGAALVGLLGATCRQSKVPRQYWTYGFGYRGIPEYWNPTKIPAEERRSKEDKITIRVQSRYRVMVDETIEILRNAAWKSGGDSSKPRIAHTWRKTWYLNRSPHGQHKSKRHLKRCVFTTFIDIWPSPDGNLEALQRIFIPSVVQIAVYS